MAVRLRVRLRVPTTVWAAEFPPQLVEVEVSPQTLVSCLVDEGNTIHSPWVLKTDSNPIGTWLTSPAEHIVNHLRSKAMLLRAAATNRRDRSRPAAVSDIG